MEELKNNKQFKILAWIFIIVSIIHVLYATITMRGMYMDGGFYMIELLNSIANSKIDLFFDSGHPRFFILWILQLPVYIANSLFFISNKFALMMIYSFVQFFLPLLILFWTYKLAKRTERLDIFFWNLLLYSGFLIIFMIFSIVETSIGSPLHFILWIYLSTTMQYTKKDIIAIIFLVIMMFATFEYVVGLGILFFLASIYYVYKEPEKKNKIIKGIIGLGSLAAAIFTGLFMFSVSGENGEIARFLKEACDFIPHALNLNLSITVATIILFGLFIFKKTPIKWIPLTSIIVVFSIVFARLIYIKEVSLSPMWEGHLRSICCWLIPLIFVGLILADILKKKNNKIVITNLICITLLCGIFQTFWQIVHTYYWNENIQYMKSELKKHDGPLYIPSEHPEIANFDNEELRRYIWHSGYAFESIIFSDTYEQKTLLMHYDEKIDDGNLTFRDALFVRKDIPNAISIPYGTTIDIKNKYWDLTKCAEALDKYNKENNIQTWQ